MTNLPLRDTSGTSLGIIRRLARLVLETRAFALVRLFLFTRELKSERERVRQAAEALRLPVFSRAVLEQLRARKPDATTAFILGTGASVAKLDSQDLAYITSQFSVGGLTAPAVAELQVSFAGVAVARTNCHLFSALRQSD